MNQKYKEKIKIFFKNKNIKKITKENLQNLKSEFAKKYNLKKLPLTSDITNILKIKNPTKTFITKPSRTLSGVTIIAVMTKPDVCPGKCIFCPSYKDAPKSYTGFEPAAMRGAINNFDPYKQIKERLKQLEATGHPTTKIEMIIMGGTFPSTSIEYQKEFMIKVYQAITDSKSKNIDLLKKKAMTSKRRLVGLTFETRPDYCDEKIIRRLIDFGATRIEIGVQSTDNKILKYVKRGHGTKESIIATEKLKDSGLKVLYHMMLNLPKSNYKKDLKMFEEITTNEKYCPDMLKIYPCLVTKYTVLEKMYYSGEYKVYDDQKTINLLADIKEKIPRWIRIMRIQRDIPATKIIGGIKKSNLREYVKKELNKRNKKCKCIRCREPNKNNTNIDFKKYEIKIETYKASKGIEYFISAEKDDVIFGFIRLRIPYKPFLEELDKKTAIVRELHVYGQATELGQKNLQHRGIGKKLLKKAEEITKENKLKKIAIISGIGVREYYKKLGYKLKKAYMIKEF
ncbi:MAG: tRNA uridine(34) 5-carboxymethylaminomethyl modification radical SAM/GNAT enzyme Elp3 [Candidatus ainarchaeum sp.]|nr:tRNA uridine(34) 5-carboxymethylaminomethyl modification radical SAM/GNAT enzyme Elp3 [Candidatus ainarchaeum sp.]MDD3975848.1 tRNA uridine(34) 5-carboxymethylaminomethyl modification radical SAM/GNAT enzyme Elp3 [Candidatus ainarchaeum sp.]